MRKYVIATLILAVCATSHAEWFRVKSVDSYNMITAYRQNEPSSEIKIRIQNLENIEDIQQNQRKVLLSGQSARNLARSMLQGQLVRIENLQQDSGIYVGVVYLSYEQVIRGYASQRMVGGNTVTPAIRSKVMEITQRMLRHLESDDMPEDLNVIKESWKRVGDNNIRYSFDSYYDSDYLKGIFVYESLKWFKDTGQFLPDGIQKKFVDWLASYQNSQPQAAKDLEIRIRDLTYRSDLYRDFLMDE